MVKETKMLDVLEHLNNDKGGYSMNVYKGNYDDIDHYETKCNCETKDDCESNDKHENKEHYENKEHCENKECREPKYCCEEKKCSQRPNRTFLKCSAPTTNIPMATDPGTSFNLANLNIDTSKFHNPCIKFEFASNIFTASGSLVFNFQIVKQCKYQPASFPIGPIWKFSRLASSVGENDMFTFPVCDCDTCEDGCCNYSVVVTIESLETQGDITINNATLSALIVDNPNC